MNANKHLLLWSSLGVLILLVLAAAQENFDKDWRRLQSRLAATEEGKELKVRLRQIMVPALGATDRCTSCHVGMGPGEPALVGDDVLGQHPDVVHDPAEFGCTVCHAGQGRATEAADAHGTALHWPEPMIPARYAEAGCGTCHTHLAVPGIDRLRRGARLFEQRDCLRCHALEGRGGTTRPGDAAGVIGPDLTRAGARGHRADWYEDHLRRARGASERGWVGAFTPMTSDEREALQVLLDSRVGAPRLVEAKALFHSLGCRGCHKIDGVGGDDGPDLTHAGERDPGQTDFGPLGGERDLAAWFAAHFRDPARVVPGSLMPALGLTDEQVDLLTLYTFSLRRGEVPDAYWPLDRVRATRLGESEFSRDPATLYGTFCAACHGPRGEGMRFAGMAPFPAIGSVDFLEAATDEFIAATIRRGRPGRRMPAWGGADLLSDAEIAALVEHLRGMAGGVQAKALVGWAGRGEAERGRHLYARLCAGCHGAVGQGKDGPALANQVLLETATDDYLAATILRGRRGTSMYGFAEPSPVRPALSSDEVSDLVAHLRSWEDSP